MDFAFPKSKRCCRKRGGCSQLLRVRSAQDVTARRRLEQRDWKQFAELGLLGVPFSEDQGGLGGGPIETMIIMEEFGKALVVEPYLATVVLGGGFLRHGGGGAEGAAHVPPIIEGKTHVAFAR